MITIRSSDARGQINHDWLHARHSFSFGEYYDPQHMGVSALRVLNDDWIAPGQGFPPHPHQNMEIITYIKHGRIAHQDSMGHRGYIATGEFQYMRAGSGILHSEYNDSDSEPLEVLQIWIEPNVIGGEPKYAQKIYTETEGLTLIASPGDNDSAFSIQQDAYLYLLNISPTQNLEYHINPGRTVYLHMISGELELLGKRLKSGDAATIIDEMNLSLLTLDKAEHSRALLFDLP